MENIFNKIIEIDNNAKSITNIEKEKKLNIDEYIENEFGIKKVVLDMEFKDEMDLQKRKYDEMFQEKQKEIDEKTQKEIEQLESSCREKENDIINNIINSIKEGGLNGD